jgi:ribosomal protein S18 acetylase RimI-like enzyme
MKEQEAGMDAHIREVTENDYAALCALIEFGDAYHRTHLPYRFKAPQGASRERDYILEMIADESIGLFVVEQQDKLLGYLKVMLMYTRDIPILVSRCYAVVDNLVVDPEFRRRGIGWSLMEHAHQWAREKGATEVELNVYEFNQSAMALYRQLGYETISRRMRLPLE